MALDAETGKELWKVKQGDYKMGQTITSAPMVIKDKVISGISGGEFGVRGFVTANDVNTGQTGLAHVQHRTRSGSRLPRFCRDVAG